MKLDSILAEVLRLLRDLHNVEHIIIWRGDKNTYQLRFTRDASRAACYRIEGRSYAGSSLREWNTWLSFGGFSVDDVIANDWKILT